MEGICHSHVSIPLTIIRLSEVGNFKLTLLNQVSLFQIPNHVNISEQGTVSSAFPNVYILSHEVFEAQGSENHFTHPQNPTRLPDLLLAEITYQYSQYRISPNKRACMNKRALT